PDRADDPLLRAPRPDTQSESRASSPSQLCRGRYRALRVLRALLAAGVSPAEAMDAIEGPLNVEQRRRITASLGRLLDAAAAYSPDGSQCRHLGKAAPSVGRRRHHRRRRC
ncbi:MAG TPA: hypothetical protein VNT27_09655, partial [Propionibacteriaceae bacterium]|nr:hypothetical protein [Propionibacteriaceae bacterium]